MRDILEDLEAGRFLSDPDPVKRAQNQMRMPLPKRFYTDVSVAKGTSGYEVHLDGKAVKTPGRAMLTLPTSAAATLVAAEFDAQQDVLNAVTMPVMRLVNTAIDGVAAEPEAVFEDILRFSASDLLFYRADSPEGLVAMQADAWDPILDWTRNVVGARFKLAEGIVHVEQPRESIGAVAIHLRGRSDALRLAALHLITSLTGSALIALAVQSGGLTPDEGWQAAHVDEHWNEAQWGLDSEAVARRNARRRDFDAAVQLLIALDADA